ncbi:MAG: hypothetical protein CBC48_13880, partial [bacterium TMED88]
MSKHTVVESRWRNWRAPRALNLLIVLMLPGWATLVHAHGAVENPASRTTLCRFDAEAMQNPMCEQAWATEPQALYDWMEVNLAAVAGAHQAQIPDGELCGAGREKYDAFNIPGDWPVTALQPGSDGLYPVTFHATAPHAAQYFRFYLTREGFDPTQDTLRWDDLELVYDSGQIAVQELTANPHYTFRMPLPDREDRAILYLVWQRSDSPEAFYGCSDVVLGESTTPPISDPIAPPAEEEPVNSTPSEPSAPEQEEDSSTNPPIATPGLDMVSVDVDLYDDWGSGACGEGTVTNQGSVNTVWEVNVDLPGTVTSYWDSEMRYSTHPDCEGSEMPHAWRAVGEEWNRTLEPGASTTFGFCFDRTLAPVMPTSDDPTLPVVDDSSMAEDGSGSHEHHHAEMEMNDDFTDLASFGMSNGSNHTGHDGLVGGRTAITTEALMAYNHLREFVGLEPASLEQVGAWAFANDLTNNSEAWGNDQIGVGLWYAMQGAKVGWMVDEKFDPQVVADISRTARLGSTEDVMAMAAQYGHDGFADYLLVNGFDTAFINTLKMEPHYAGWMHDRAHGWLSIEDVAIAHDVNHLTVLSHDQMQPFMNDTWDWPQWPALDVTEARVLEYFQSMVVLGNPLDDHLESLSAPVNPQFPDGDGDGVYDHLDNCANVANDDQMDGDQDGYGNACDADLNNNGVVDLADLVQLLQALGTFDAASNLDGVPGVGLPDLVMMLSKLGEVPGPSAHTAPPTDGPTDPGAAPVEEPNEPAPGTGSTLQQVAATTGVHVMVDPATGLAYLHEQGGAPILITRSDDYWDGAVPLTRDDATLMAAARDGQGRLRVLDGGGMDVYAWILDETGAFIGEEGPSSTSMDEKESLFQMDIDGDGMIGGGSAPPSDPDPEMPPMDDH